MKRTIILLGAAAVFCLSAGVAQSGGNFQCVTTGYGCIPYSCYKNPGTCDTGSFDTFSNTSSTVGYCMSGTQACDDQTKILICSTIFYISYGIPGDPGCDFPVCDVSNVMSNRCKP